MADVFIIRRQLPDAAQPIGPIAGGAVPEVKFVGNSIRPAVLRERAGPVIPDEFVARQETARGHRDAATVGVVVAKVEEVTDLPGLGYQGRPGVVDVGSIPHARLAGVPTAGSGPVPGANLPKRVSPRRRPDQNQHEDRYNGC